MIDKIIYNLLFASITVAQPKLDWQLIDNKHWQPLTHNPKLSPHTIDAYYGNRGRCLPGMIQITGRMKQDPSNNSIEELQKTTCTKWINREYPERCAKFDREKWLNISREFKTSQMNFCIDRYEYPNEYGQYPMIFVNYYEAENICKDQGKRLCNEEEWTFACEGEEATPYPYGYERSAEACVIDKHWLPFHESRMQPRNSIYAMIELDDLWQGEPSGYRPNCKSSFGVFDLTGNVDEWTRSKYPHGNRSILKGGYWGPVRTRCRPSTRSHNEGHYFYQQGLRCCADL